MVLIDNKHCSGGREVFMSNPNGHYNDLIRQSWKKMHFFLMWKQLHFNKMRYLCFEYSIDFTCIHVYPEECYSMNYNTTASPVLTRDRKTRGKTLNSKAINLEYALWRPSFEDSTKTSTISQLSRSLQSFHKLTTHTIFVSVLVSFNSQFGGITLFLASVNLFPQGTSNTNQLLSNLA